MPTMKWIADHIDTLWIGNEEICCVNCKHFYQHYVIGRHDGRYTPTDCGHCTATQRVKSRKAYDHCERFEMRKP